MLLKIKATSHTSIPDHGPQLQTMSYTRRRVVGDVHVARKQQLLLEYGTNNKSSEIGHGGSGQNKERQGGLG
jgi:hypothetical protein